MKDNKNPIQDDLSPTAQIICPVCGSTFSSLTKFCPNDGQALFSTQAISKQLIPNYEFTGEIGSGGMGVVYKATHVVLKKAVAIKVLPIHQLDQNGIKRFQQEARAASLLTHKNLVAVSDCGVTVTGQPYMVMDYVAGKTLERLLKEKGTLEEKEALPIFEQICQGIEHAHAKGVLHRDLKPSNIMLIDTESGNPDVKVLDFGIAKILHGELKLTKGLTATGDVFGSPPYMSPEQAMGKDVDVRSDIYSLACVMYETLTGAPPLIGSTMMETVYKQIHDQAPSLSQASLGKKFSAAWETFMAKALAKEPDNRFKSIAEMRAELPGKNQSAARPLSPESTPRSGKQAFKHRLLLVVSCTIPLMAVLFFMYHGSTRLTIAPAAAPKIEVKKQPKVASSDSPPDKSPLQEQFWGGYTPDAMAEQMIRNSNSLKLDLSKGPGKEFTDQGLKVLKSKGNVEELILRNDRISDKGVDFFTHLHLHSLDLSSTLVTDEGLKTVCNKITSLQELGLNDMHITDISFRYISHLPKLRSLSANKITKLSDRALAFLGKTRTLTSLSLENCPAITSAGVAHLANLEELTYLNLSGTRVDDRCGATLQKLTNLSALNLEGTAISDETIACLTHLKLTALNVARTRISSRGIQTLSTIKTLTQLNLGGTRITYDRVLENLSTLPNLESLDLTNCHWINDWRMRSIPAIKSLNSLRLGDTMITSNSLDQIARLKQLRYLDVSFTAVDDQGIDSLLNLSLQTLLLSNTHVTAAGFIKLAQMKELTDLVVQNLPLTAQDHDRFRQAEKKVKPENQCCAIDPRLDLPISGL